MTGLRDVRAVLGPKRDEEVRATSRPQPRPAHVDAILLVVVKRRWRGQWWEPGKEDKPQPGTLNESDDGHLTLELHGGFDLHVWEVSPDGVRSNGGETRDVPMLLGQTPTGPFTLLNVQNKKTEGLSEPTFQQLHVGRALDGYPLAEPDSKIFTSAWIRLENLLPWLHQDPVVVSAFQDEPAASIKTLSPVQATFGEMTCTAKVTSRPFQRRFLRNCWEVHTEVEEVGSDDARSCLSERLRRNDL